MSPVYIKVALLFIGIAAGTKTFAQDDTCLKTSVTTLPDDIVKKDSFKNISDLKIKLNSIKEKFYCRDQRAFFYYTYEALKKFTDENPSAKNIEILFSQKWNLPKRGDEYVYGGDAKRIAIFNTLFKKYKKSPPLSSKNNRSKIHVVLVGGYGNDFLQSSTFPDFQDVLETEFGVSVNNIHRVFPSSLSRLHDARTLLEKTLREIIDVDENAEIVILGFSRGGLVMLDTLFRNPDLIKNTKQAVTLQSPLSGTPVAEIAKMTMDLVEKFLKTANKSLNFERCNCLRFHDLSAGAESLFPEEAKKVVDLISTLNDSDRQHLSKKVFYISSSGVEPTKVGTYIMRSVKNDGTVPLYSQHILGFGNRLADLKGIGHTDLVMSGVKSSLSKKDRDAFVRTVFTMLENPNLNSEDKFDDPSLYHYDNKKQN